MGVKPVWSDEMQKWLDEVCGMIRWRRARPVVRQELADHLEDQAQAFADEGVPGAEAARRAVAEMGDPIEVGAGLDQAYRPQPDWALLGVVMLLVAAGMVLQTLVLQDVEAGVLVAGASRRVWSNLLPGGVCLLFGYFFDYTRIYRWNGRVALCLVAAFCLCFFNLDFVKAAPLFYTAAVLMYIGLLCRAAHARLAGAAAGIGGLLGMGLLLFCYQFFPYPNTGKSFAVLCFLVSGVLLCMTCWHTGFGFPLRRARTVCLGSIAIAAVGCIGFLAAMPAAQRRLAVLCNPMLEFRTAGWQSGIAQMTLRGEALDGTPAIQYLVSPESDYLLTWSISRFGWGALAAVLCLYLLLLALCVRQWKRQQSLLARLVVCCVTGLWTAQSLCAISTGLGHPVTRSVCMPFLANGAVSLCVNLFLMGLLLSVGRTGKLYGASDTVRRPSKTERKTI